MLWRSAISAIYRVRRNNINENQTNWDEWIPYAMFTYNMMPHMATNYNPFKLLYGHQVTLPTTLSLPKPIYTYDNYAKELK